MSGLDSTETVTLLVGLAVMLAVARLVGELFSRFGQPAIVGEILAGILLGPSVLGGIFPEFGGWLFPAEGDVALAFRSINLIAVILLLLIAGLEVDLSILWEQGRTALLVSVLGVIIPFALGFGAGWIVPGFFGVDSDSHRLVFALFLGTALSISALPVAARILMDLGIFKTDVGMLVMGAAMFNDLTGWIIFSIVLSMMAGEGGGVGGHGDIDVVSTIIFTLLTVVVALTLLRWSAHRLLPWIQARLSWPGGVLSFILVLAFAGAALTEQIGVHAIFGAFLVGIAIGDSKYLREQTRAILHQFVTHIFAPIFFVSIGLHVDFLAHFDLWMVVVVILISFVGKSVGSVLGARLGGMDKRTSYAVGAGMNAHGAMEIILGILALESGVIGEEMFIALVMLALFGATVSGPLMSLFIVRPKSWLLSELIVPEQVVSTMQATTREEAIAELAATLGRVDAIDPEVVTREAIEREEVMGTGLGEEIAVPHARMEGATRPHLVVGHSPDGIDFDAPDGLPARLVFLLVTPRGDDASQVQIVGQIARFFRRREARELLYEGESVDVLRAAVKIEPRD